MLATALLWASPAPAEEPQQQLPKLRHTAWSQDTGAPPNIWAIGQSPQGDLWLASGAGLYRFDGVRFEQFRSDGVRALPSEIMGAMLVTPAGDVWVGYHSGGISVIRDGRITNYADGPPKGTVKQFVQGPDGAVWIASFGGVAIFRDGRWTSVKWDPAYGRPFNMLAGRDGSLWVAAQHAFLRIDPVTLRVQKTNEPVSGAWALTEAPDGRLWLSDEALGLRILDPAQVLRPDFVPARKAPSPAQLLVPRRLLFDSAGVLWGAHEDGKGIFRILDPRRAPSNRILTQADVDQTYGATQGLTSDLPGALFQDRERNIWVGGTLGLDRFSVADIVTARSIPSSTREGYRAVVTPQGRLYLADADTLYRFDDAGRPEAIHRGLGHPNELCAGRDGQVWMAADRGLSRLEGRRLVPMPLPPAAQRRVVLACAQDGAGDLWASIAGVGLFRQDGATWRGPLKAHLPDGFFPRILVASAKGDIWAADPGFDLFAIGKAGVRRITAADGLDIGEIKFIKADAQGGVLAGGERGLARGGLEGRFQSLTVDRRPALSLVSGIAEDGLGATWIGTIHGVIKLSTRALDKAFADPAAPLDMRRFDVRDGLSGAPQQHCCHGTVFADGRQRIWLLTNRAVGWVDPRALSHNPVPPTVSILGVTANNEPRAVRPDMRLMSNVRDLRIDFAAPSLVAPDRVRVLYRLRGVDADWVDPGARRQAFYTRLRPGHYRFSVIAANNDGVWNKTGATLDFVIPPTFVQSRTFLALLALGLASIVGGAFFLRLHFAALRIEQRYEARLAERERIARELHDTLLQTVQGLVLKFHGLVGGLPSNAVRGQMEEALDRAELVVTESRDRIMDLRTVRSSEDLVRRLRGAADLSTSRRPPELRVISQGETRRMIPSALDEIIQIGSEAIRNAVSHSGGDLVEVEVAFEPAAFRLTVSDNGVGIPAGRLEHAARQGHYGFVGMRERARNLGGELAVDGQDGTRVELIVPARNAYETRRWFLDRLLRPPERVEIQAPSGCSPG
ncbi:sensor histidine kinase [Caulobacter soli]|uniref:sensor histidine kinase n=1 Tax=Caulobacter soli TaxID=2708539 RepID=UPI0013EDFCD6|nr:sensor histidine kinase [Caulobacter soli]